MWVSPLVGLHLFMIIYAQGFYTNELRTSESPDVMYKSRCTRRFTPGVCEQPATTVWTFAFHTQNCSERLGCATSHRTNRFPTYRQCMRRCRPLINIYLQILTNDNYTNMFFLRNQPDATGRREGDSILIALNDTLDIDEGDKNEEPNSIEEPLFNLYYRDETEVEVSLTPDIDYVMQQRQEENDDYVYEN